MPTIACVIPAYNREGSIERAVRSALDQTVPPQEIIVVDDGSTDGTQSVVAAFGSSVRCITQENAGCASARNRGVHEAQSEWVAFLDSDDYWTPHHLEKMELAISETRGEADYYFANVQRPATEGELDQWQLAHFSIAGDWKLKRDGQHWVLRPRIPMMLQGTVFCRERFLTKGGLWEELRSREDTHCFLAHGTGYPLCAVNHIGTIMTADAKPSNRLTGTIDPTSDAYWLYSVQLWRDLADRLSGLSKPSRKLLEFRLFKAHWSLMLIAIRSGHPWKATLYSMAALRVSPHFFLGKVSGRRLTEKDIVPSNAIDEGLPD